MPGKALDISLLTTNKISSLDPAEYLIIWPVASLEQHGPHLPLGTDAILLSAVVDGVREKLGEDFKGLFLPIERLGKSPEHVSFPGTISLQSSTLLAIASDIVSSLSRHGFKSFVFLNSHGGNISILDAVSYDLREIYGVKVYPLFLWKGNNYDVLLKRVFPDMHDLEIHAASLETSVMMYLYPELVGEIPPANPAAKIIGSIPFGWNSLDFGKSGVIGDPSFATAQAGKELFQFAVDDVCNILRSIVTELNTKGM